jgi:hypothetical protein
MHCADLLAISTLIVNSGGYALVENKTSAKRLKRDISIRDANGRPLDNRKVTSYRSLPLMLPEIVFDELCRTNMLAQEGQESDGRVIFRPTELSRFLVAAWSRQVA